MSEKYSEAVLNPQAVYRNPSEVVADADLSVKQKREVLDAWKSEATHLQESSAEGFEGGERSQLDEVLDALRQLD